MNKIKKISFFIVVFCFVFLGIKNTFANEKELKTIYSAYFEKSELVKGWSNIVEDNTKLWYQNDYPLDFKIGLINQDKNLTGTISYEVKPLNKEWISKKENLQEIGTYISKDGIEAIKIKLTGDLNKLYDVYYSVLQNGEFGEWIKNGEVSGEENKGKIIYGLRISVIKKGGGLPQESKVLASNKKEDKSKNFIIENKEDVTEDTGKKIALTYDDGPNPRLTNRLLDILKENNAKATFFVVGLNAKSNFDTLKRMYAEGHEIGNHTYAHKDLARQSRESRYEAIVSTNNIIKDAIGVYPKLIRPPYGSYNKETIDILKELSMSSILWNIDTLDWKHKDAQKIIDHVLKNAKDGDIVLMHDIHETTIRANEVLIKELINRGFELVSVSELSKNRAKIEVGQTYNSFKKK